LHETAMGALATSAISISTVRPGTTQRATEKIPDDGPAMNRLGSVAYRAAAPRIASDGSSGDSPSSSLERKI